MAEANSQAEEPKLDLRNPVLAGVLAWLVPGLGHWYQGRTGKAVLYFVCIYSVMFIGLDQGGWKNLYYRKDAEEHRWAFYAQLGAGAIALPAIIDAPRVRQFLPASWRDFGKVPSEQEIDNLHLVGKRTDIALIYTIIAGLLNMLVILDAYAGPAHYEEERKLLAKEAAQARMGRGARLSSLLAVFEFDPNLNAHWYLPPLVIAVSLVYSATRYETWPMIFKHAIHWSVYVLMFLGATYLILWLIWLDLRWYWYVPVTIIVLWFAFFGATVPRWTVKPKEAPK